MFFNSVSYLFFLIISVTIYWLLPAKRRWWLCLGASLVFYGSWRIEYVFVIGFSAFVDYFVSLRIAEAASAPRRKMWLVGSLVINLGLLAYFKYTYFIADNIILIGKVAGENWHFSLGQIILPLGISFYTFVSLSYTLDIYRGLLDPVRDFRLYLTYVMFWPHMIAGPILRGHELITQLVRSSRFDSKHIIIGIKLILAGLFLKIGADQLSPLVDDAFNLKTQYVGGLDVWTMAFGFGLQIYFDFAGYSLIAIGSARLMGIHFPDNFNWPYLSTSPRDFWKRWHITLSSWVRDYLYLPLMGARYRDRSDGGIDVELEKRHSSTHWPSFALFLSWFIIGLWHGASWNYAFWGIWHAILIFIYRIVKNHFNWIPERGRPIAGWCVTMPLIMLGWIPFRAATLGQTFALYARLFDFTSYRRLAFRENFYLLVFFLTIGMFAVHALMNLKLEVIQNRFVKHGTEALVFSVMIFIIFIFLKPVKQFIYFQF